MSELYKKKLLSKIFVIEKSERTNRLILIRFAVFFVKLNLSIDCLCSCLQKLLYMFKMMSEIAYTNTWKLVYNSLCESILRYWITVWGPASKTHLLTLEICHLSILKTAYRKPFRYSTGLLYWVREILIVRQIFIFSTVLRFQKGAILMQKSFK